MLESLCCPLNKKNSPCQLVSDLRSSLSVKYWFCKQILARIDAQCTGFMRRTWPID